MSESHRPEAFEYGDGEHGEHGDEAAELEQLRREASLLREQLQSAGSSREVQQLDSRLDSLTARNAKLMDTLKEARQQLLALR